MRMRQKWIAIAMIIGGVGLCKTADATMLQELSTVQLTQQSNSVTIGEVTASHSAWDPEKRMVFTYIDFKVNQTLKGRAQERLTIRQAGGRANGIGMIVHGMAVFHPGERALLFLSQDAEGVPSIVNMAQGKFRIYRSVLTGEDMALFRAPKNLEFHTHGQHIHHPQEKRIPLRDLIEEIQDVVRSESK